MTTEAFIPLAIEAEDRSNVPIRKPCILYL